MIAKNNLLKSAFVGIMAIFALVSCEDLGRPGDVGNYPKDVNPPGGPLKFYAALEGSDVDSIRANFGNDQNISYVAGINGKGIQPSASPKNGYISWASANDFGGVTNFSVSLWMNAGTTDKKDHNNADGILAFGKSSDFWGNFTLFADHEASKSDSMVLKAVIGGNWVTYEGDKGRIPHMYDGNWHHLVFTYDSSKGVYTFYLDGKQYDQRSVSGVAFKDASVLVLGGFQQAAGIQGDYNGNSWMSAFPGTLDQIRLYGTTLSAADVSTLYTGKK